MAESQNDRPRVLIVQAERESLEICAAAAEAEQLAPIACSTGRDALHLAETGVDAILLGSSLPDMEASDVCRKLKSRRATRYIPIVMLTNRRSDGSLSPLAERADDVLARPFHLLELRLRLRTAADLGRTLKAVRTARERLFAGIEVGSDESPALARAAEASADYERPSMIGRVVAGCRLVEKLGRSEKRLVYLGQHRMLGLRVCVKLLPVSLADWSPDELARFIRGARAAARIEHPNVVPVLNAGREEQFYYVIRRFVDGRALDTYLEEDKPMDVDQALRLARQVAQGLAAAHKMNVIHRDVKPANIIVTPAGEAKLIDFGLARSLGGGDISSSGEIVGTPHYMSPEQCDGDHVDARADIYSLGATLYHMVTGRLPFNAATLVELLRKQINEDPPPIHELNPRVPDSLARVIERMMSKNREDRFPSVDALLAELSGVRS
jgi:CheY-like chemotaxis protein